MHPIVMCKSKKRSDGIEPNSTSTPPLPPSSRTTPKRSATPKQQRFTSSSSNYDDVSTSYAYNDSSSSSTVSTRTSLSSLRSTFPQNPLIFDFSEICSATANFLAGKLSSSAWRCSLRGQDVVVSQRKLRFPVNPSRFYKQISSISRAHHNSLIKLVGASISGDHVYIVYEYIHGVNLSDCLRNPRNPNYTVLNNWISRIQIATDLAHGLDYIHNFASSDSQSVHNRIKSSSVVVTDSPVRAKLCHFGTADLIGETAGNGVSKDEPQPEIQNRSKRFEGARGYMSPEFKSSGVGTRQSDVFAFGVVMLELISGKEPLRFEFDEARGCYITVSVVESAREAAECGGEGRLRRWVDWRLKDSFPVGVVREMTRIALECVSEDPTKRPGMGRVAGKVSKLYIESKAWTDMVGELSDVTVSLAPR